MDKKDKKFTIRVQSHVPPYDCYELEGFEDLKKFGWNEEEIERLKSLKTQGWCWQPETSPPLSRKNVKNAA